MKKFILSVCLLAGLSACQLDETPFSEIYTDTFYQTQQDAEAALISIYAPIGSLYGLCGLMAADFSDDQTYPRPVVGRNALTQFTYDNDYSVFKSFAREAESPLQIWRVSYQGIERANWVIAKIPQTPMNETRRTQILAEAYFLRAFYHWTLARNFNEVPLKLQPSVNSEAATIGKATKADIYKQIYADLDQALSGLPRYPANDKGRTCREAALCLYAKAGLYNEDWATALRRAEELTQSANLGLLPVVRDLYNINKEVEARREVLLAFEGERADGGRFTNYTALFGPANSSGLDYGKNSFGSIFAYQAFFDSFDPKDQRRQNLDTTYVNQQGRVVGQRSITPITPKAVLVKKYQDPLSTATGSASNVPILRYADALLIAAEAEARLSGATTKAYGYVNQIRSRAGLPNLTAGLSKDAFINAVLQERKWEFFAEGDRWYDLTRTNTFLQVIPKAVNDVYPTRTPQAKHRYFPIPLDEVLANSKLQQNPDWK